MKTRITSIMMALLFAAGLSFIQAAPAKAEGSFLKVPVGVSYSSIYWWRGVELNGKGVGVMWPSVGLQFGETGLSLLVTAGLNTDYFVVDKSGDKDTAKVYHEFDYGIAYSKDLGEMLSLGIGAMYVHYPFYDEVNSSATNPSFFEGSLSLGLKTVLSPKVDVYYDYYVEEDDTTKNPTSEDYYIKFSLSQEIAKEGDFSATLSAWLAYYNNAYFDATGFSDAGVKLGLSQAYEGIAFTSGVYYARTLSSDFYRDYDLDGDGEISRLKNHFWADFGVSYTF